MGDPVTTGMVIGAAGGALTNRKNPLQGAMLGGALGASGGSLYQGAASAAGASTVGSANAMIPGVQGGGGALVGESTALTNAAPSFTQRIGAGFSNLGSDLSSMNKWMNQNPITTQIGLRAAEQAMQPPEPIPMPGGMPVQRGQIQPMDYMSLLAPQQSQVLRPATPSLI